MQQFAVMKLQNNRSDETVFFRHDNGPRVGEIAAR